MAAPAVLLACSSCQRCCSANTETAVLSPLAATLQSTKCVKWIALSPGHFLTSPAAPQPAALLCGGEAVVAGPARLLRTAHARALGRPTEAVATWPPLLAPTPPLLLGYSMTTIAHTNFDVEKCISTVNECFGENVDRLSSNTRGMDWSDVC